MLDEECIIPNATDLTLAQKLNNEYLNKHPNFQQPETTKLKKVIILFYFI